MTDGYIRREDASNWLKQYGQDVLHGKYKFSLMYIWKNIMDLPPADVVRVVHGRWIDDGTEFGCQCSECGKSLDDYAAPTEYASLNEIPNFCPNCGAKMDGKKRK